jgi:hypothetical protein
VREKLAEAFPKRLLQLARRDAPTNEENVLRFGLFARDAQCWHGRCAPGTEVLVKWPMEETNAGSDRFRELQVSAAFRLRRVLQRIPSIRRRRLAEVATKRSHEDFVAPEAVRQRNGANRCVVRRQLRSCALQLEAQRELLKRFAGDTLKFTMQLKSRLACTLCNCFQCDAAAQATSDVVQQKEKVVARRHSGSIVVQQRSCDLIFLAPVH